MFNGLQSLTTLFNNSLFRIPDYQRGYAWGQVELEAFWQDLDRLADGRKHYTGQLTLERVGKPTWSRWDEGGWLIDGQGYKPFYVVDGQQRITTAIILIKCLLEALAADADNIAYQSRADVEKKYLVVRSGKILSTCLFGYEKDNPSHEHFKTRILGHPGTQDQQTETVYTTNLSAARDFFAKCLAGAPHEELERWFKALTQRFLFNIHELDDDLDVYVAFETMNNRGKSLSKLELLKNRLIYLSTLLPAPVSDDERTALRTSINDAWKTAYEYLGRKRGQELSDDGFLRAHWTMYWPYSRDDASQFGKLLLEQKFTAKDVLDGKLTASAILSYVRSVQDCARLWYAIHFSFDAPAIPDEAKPWLERLGRLGHGAFGPLLMAALHMKAPAEQFVRLLIAAERFVFVINRLCRLRVDTGDSEFYRRAGAVFKGEALDDVTRTIKEHTQWYYSTERVRAQMKDHQNGFYGWRGLRYLLFEYEQHLRARAVMQAERLTWHGFNPSGGDNASIEHIYPQSPNANEWPEFAVLSPEVRYRLLHSLGNLVAVSSHRNSKLSNRSFAAKRIDAHGAVGYQNGSYSEIEVSKVAKWTPESVRDRGLTILEFLEARWEVALGTEAEKRALLEP